MERGGGEGERRGEEYKRGVKGRIIEIHRNNTLYKQCPEAPLPPKCLEQAWGANLIPYCCSEDRAPVSSAPCGHQYFMNSTEHVSNEK